MYNSSISFMRQIGAIATQSPIIQKLSYVRNVRLLGKVDTKVEEPFNSLVTEKASYTKEPQMPPNIFRRPMIVPKLSKANIKLMTKMIFRPNR